VKRHTKLAVGDVIEHGEFGVGVVERQSESIPGTFSVVFEEGSKYVKDTSDFLIGVNGLPTTVASHKPKKK
jgi:hypothetical protein